MIIRRAIVALTLPLFAIPIHATTVAPISFAELVDQSELVFVGEAIDSRAIWETRGGVKQISTIVGFNVIKILKGQTGQRAELNFAGGTIDNVSQTIAGMPQFQEGDRDVLFVSADRQAISPLVGFWHGRYRVVRDQATGRESVRTHDGLPVLGGMNLRDATAQRTPLSGSLSLEQFAAMVTERLAQRPPPR